MPDDAPERDDRLVPGGATPARTPGASGPTSRDRDRAVVDDATEAVIAQTEIAGRIHEQPKRSDY